MTSCSCHHGDHMHGADGCFAKVSGPSSDDYYCSCSYVPVAKAFEILDTRRSRALLLRSCTKHKRYKALRAPRSACESCWRLWIEVHPEPVNAAWSALLRQFEKKLTGETKKRSASSPTRKRRGSSVRPRARHVAG